MTEATGRRRSPAAKTSRAAYSAALPAGVPVSVLAVDPRQLALDIATNLQALTRAQLSTTTFAEQWAWWKPIYLARLASKESFGPRVERYLLPKLGELSEATLSTEKIEEALNGLEDKLSPATLNHLRAHGLRIINDLIRVKPPRWTSANPFASVLKRAVPTREPFIPSEAELIRLIETNQPHIQPRFAMQIGLGERYGELRGLRVEDVDLRNRRVYLRRSGHRETLKNGEQRSVPVPDWLFPYVEVAIAYASTLGSPWLFPGRKGGQLSKNSKPGQLLARALRRAGIVRGYRQWCAKRGCGFAVEVADAEPRRCPTHDRLLRVSGLPQRMSIHTLRHVAITLMQERGVHPLVVSRIVGHGKKSTTARYTHFSDAFIRAELAKAALSVPPGGEIVRQDGQMQSSLDIKGASSSVRIEHRPSKAMPYSDEPGRSPSPNGLLFVPANERPLLTVEEVAARLKCDPGTVLNHIHGARLRAQYVGRLLRVAEEDLAALIDGRGPVDAFWRRVRKTAGCWFWLGPTRRKGYGAIWWEGRQQGAHRVAYQLEHGPIKDGMHVLHHCDEPRCVKPAHLFLGTNAENMADKAAKGRQARGPKNGRAKLSEVQVREIRAAERAPGAAERLAPVYGVTPRAIRHIWAGTNWKASESSRSPEAA